MIVETKILTKLDLWTPNLNKFDLLEHNFLSISTYSSTNFDLRNQNVDNFLPFQSKFDKSWHQKPNFLQIFISKTKTSTIFDLFNQILISKTKFFYKFSSPKPKHRQFLTFSIKFWYQKPIFFTNFDLPNQKIDLNTEKWDFLSTNKKKKIKKKKKKIPSQWVNGAAVLEISDHGDDESVDGADLFAHREHVEQRLRRMLSRPIAGVDQRTTRTSRSSLKLI